MKKATSNRTPAERHRQIWPCSTPGCRPDARKCQEGIPKALQDGVNQSTTFVKLPISGAMVCSAEAQLLGNLGVLAEVQEKAEPGDLASLTIGDLCEEVQKAGLVGQESSTKKLCGFILRALRNGPDKRTSNMKALLAGPTGSGKTEMLTILRNILKRYGVFLYHYTNAASLTSSGIVGTSVAGVVHSLLDEVAGFLNERNNDPPSLDDVLDAIHTGQVRIIMVLDEFDKLRRKKGDTTQVKGEAVQHELLEMLDGKPVIYQPDPRNSMSSISVDFKYIDIILAGAFEQGIDGLSMRNILSGQNNSREMFRPEPANQDMACYSHISSPDLVRYGFIPEIVGRIKVIIGMNFHTPDTLKDIVLGNIWPKVVQEIKEISGSQIKDVELEENALKWLIKKAMRMQTGARAAEKVFEGFMNGFCSDLEGMDAHVNSVLLSREALEAGEAVEGTFRSVPPPLQAEVIDVIPADFMAQA